MTNVLVTQNLFNGSESYASIFLSVITTATISENILNQDNTIQIYHWDTITINNNVIYNSTADAILMDFATNSTIKNNLIYNATNNGINFADTCSGIMVTCNNIVGSSSSGILIGSGEEQSSSDFMINNNNIESNVIGLTIYNNSYDVSSNLLDATSNYWNSSSGAKFILLYHIKSSR